ncbi:MAG: NmrA family protein [Chitinophagaceae bacterium]|nr:MAG: NmrA family protein [Chitinophagaceae bacterium]
MIVPQPSAAPVILCGATGALGRRIAHHLFLRGAAVRALVRPGSRTDVPELRGATLVPVNYEERGSLLQACSGGSCIVSALSGLEDVIVDTQSRLLDAAVKAGVPRFIPSDYCIDYTRLQPGGNRNLDLRRRFAARLDAAPVRATGILNGMFTDLLTGQAPVVLRKQRRILYWGSTDVPLDFTTMEDTAAYTAAAALDETSPRYLRIAGDVRTIRQLQAVAASVFGEEFRLLRPGGLGTLRTLIRVTRFLVPARKEVFPPWQGMQYLHDMLSGQAKLETLDNNRYSDLNWTGVAEVLAGSVRREA